MTNPSIGNRNGMTPEHFKLLESLKLSKSYYALADRTASEHIKPEHLAEGIHYRSLDREGWAG